MSTQLRTKTLLYYSSLCKTNNKQKQTWEPPNCRLQNSKSGGPKVLLTKKNRKRKGGVNLFYDAGYNSMFVQFALDNSFELVASAKKTCIILEDDRPELVWKCNDCNNSGCGILFWNTWKMSKSLGLYCVIFLKAKILKIGLKATAAISWMHEYLIFK